MSGPATFVHRRWERRTEIIDGVVDPFLAIDIDIEQLRARDLDEGAFGQFGVDTGEASSWHEEPPQV